MPFVIDTSVTMAWCFEDEATDATEQLLDDLRSDNALVPGLWRLEVANVLLVAERRRRLVEAQSVHFVDLLKRLPIYINDTTHDTEATRAAGRQHGLSAYDAAYLLLAERFGCPLATLDSRLTDACRAVGVPLALP